VRIVELLERFYLACKRTIKLQWYIHSKRKPHSMGYADYRQDFIEHTLQNAELLQRFRANTVLPEGYGAKLDERVVEYPWIMSHLDSSPAVLMDAGSTLNFDFLLRHPHLAQKTIVVYDIAPNNVIRQSNISYIYGDLRQTLLRDESFDIITCISVLEHIGMDNTIYSSNLQFRESAPQDYRNALQEFYRLLKPQGKLFLTLPYGKYEDHKWFQQFDAAMVEDVIDCFQPRDVSIWYYQYSLDGWSISTSEACRDCRYHDPYEDSISPDYAAGARAVVCLECTK
jgi:SAM-dependent methyltransferase